MILELLKILMLDHHTKKIFKLIKYAKHNALQNMSIDKELLREFENNLNPIFRTYSWETSCTIGVSQKFDDLVDIQEYSSTYAKRLTGGGILFHGNDISYSLIIPTQYMKTKSVKQSYEIICAFLLDFYKSFGLNAIFAKDDKNIKFSKNAYCQIGFEEYDIVINGKKIGGNAQKRTRNAIFQHGSIALSSSCNDKKYGNSLSDFGIDISYEEASKKLIKSFQKVFNIEFEEEEI